MNSATASLKSLKLLKGGIFSDFLSTFFNTVSEDAGIGPGQLRFASMALVLSERSIFLAFTEHLVKKSIY
jgi:hypothetical protein